MQMAKESRMQEYTIDIGPYNVRNVQCRRMYTSANGRSGETRAPD
jgi:hypothetical protein